MAIFGGRIRKGFDEIYVRMIKIFQSDGAAKF